MIFIIVALVVLALVGFALAALGFQLMQQSGRILGRVDTLEEIATERLMSAPRDVTAGTGLPVDSLAPGFELPDLNGRARSLGEWRGRRTLLIFFDPASHYCLRLLDSLRALKSDVTPSERPVPLIISIGEPELTRRVFDSIGGDLPVLVHYEAEVARAYIVDAVPASYIISEDGLIAGTIAYGTQAVLVAAGEMGRSALSTSASQQLAADDVGSQHGLSAGTQAPIFRLPRLGGGEISLLEYRGKDTLLVFSDPECEPCLDLLPRLIEVVQRRPALGVVVVSRGDEAANTQHFAAAGDAIAVGLQRSWEVSRDYGLIATPIGYLVDEWGILASDVATGVEAILALTK